MAGISPLSGIQPAQWPQGPSPVESPKKQAHFGDVLKSAVDTIDADQREAGSAVQDLLRGRSDNVMPVIRSVAKADMSFKLLMGVRNKMIEAYKQTMNMQV